MDLQRSERDYYVLELATTPVLTGTWQASFDGGATWVDGTTTVDGWWAWLVAGPDFDAAAVGQDPSDTKATISADIQPLLRLGEDPVLDVEHGPAIYVV